MTACASRQNIHDRLREQMRQKLGRNPQPTAAVLDSQSVKTTEKGGRVVTTVTKRSSDASGICS
jgi:putative transposase